MMACVFLNATITRYRSINLKMFLKNDFKYVLKATSKQKSNIVRSLKRLRTISERIDENISTQILR